MKYLFLAFLISSCSIIKSLKKDKHETDTKVEESKQKETQKDIKTLTEIKADTVVNLKGSEITGITDLRDHQSFVLEDADQSITIEKDSSGSLKITGKVKDRKVPIKFTKKVEQEIKETVKEKSDSTGQQITKNKSSDKEVKITGFPWWVYLIILIAVLLALWSQRKRFGL